MSDLGHIYVIDDDASMRSSLSRMLINYGYSVSVFERPEDFIEESIPVSPAAILLDMRMPTMPGTELQKRLNELGRNTPIIFISGESMPHEIVTAMKQGAIDFLFKPFNLDDLLKAVASAVEKDKEVFKVTVQSMTVTQRYESLTPREKQVCTLLVEGLMNKDIAVRLGTTDATIKVHKSRVMEKMQADSLQDLVRFLALVKV
ncbi:MAG: response regulator transcription factor [Polynucleobacter sp.]